MRKTVALAALALVSGCGGAGSAKYTAATPQLARQLLSLRLKAHYLTVHWIACVRNGRIYQGAAIVRCNVNFGDPHIEAYCSLLRNRRLVTDHDDSAIPCGHDGAGWKAPIVGS